MKKSKTTSYFIAFGAAHGAGPWICCFCTNEILPTNIGSEKLHIHHKDNDHSNNIPDNLDPAHAGCHHRYHREIEYSFLTKEQRRDRTAAGREAMLRKPNPRFSGKKHTDETKKKMSLAQLQRREVTNA